VARTMTKLIRALPLAAVPVVALSLAGCTKTIKQGDLENKISENISKQLGQKPKVACPSGQKAKKGNSFNCTATLAGQKATIVVKLTDDNGKFTFQVKQ
jgi:hypothetical protein